MPYSEILNAKKRIKVIEKLANEFDYHEVKGKDYETLKRTLVSLQAMQIDNECAANKFF
ncbi:hypothetical protein [Amphibacillus jilinensis]|uniref:hypothetical protein n=1 Tax=Amphibacillus jilinensis TaxID=1216008 RepID=UPI0002E6B16C|nr:hypothetical protein [Amphibacillus jilinensis]